MKKSLIIIFLFLGFAGAANAGNIFKTKYDYQADVKVYSCDYDYQADLIVYVCGYDYQASGKDYLWYFVDYDYQADAKVFFTKYDYQADLKVYFCKYDYQAKWNNKGNKFVGMFSGK
jgi:hypothetical protein